MSFAKAPIFDITRLVDLRTPDQSSYCLLIAPSHDSGIADQLRDELEVQSGSALVLIDGSSLSFADLLEQVRQAESPVVLITGLDSWQNALFRSLDVNRSRLDSGAFVIFQLDLPGAARFFANAPNIRSWFGTRVFIVAPDPGSMSAEEVSSRLEQLRNHYKLTDEAVIEQAEKRSLPAKPHFVEWLVLLGRGDLVR